MAIKRHFLGWDQPALPLVADYLLQRYATPTELDLSGVILVFPGRRASRRMLELLVERAENNHPGFLPPRMVTFSHFPEMLYPQQQQLADDLTQLLVWRRAVREVPDHEIHPAVASLPGEDSLASWIRLCDSIRRQHDELAAEGLDFDDVFTILARANSAEEAARWKALRRIQAEYLMQMDGLELWDRQSARLIAVDQKECRTEHDIVLVGTVDINGIVKKMLDQVAERVTALICAPESSSDSFDAWGCLVPAKWQKRSIHIPAETVVVTNDPEDQADGVLEQLVSFDGRHRADEIAIGVADSGLVPVMLQSLGRAGISGRWPVGSLVQASPPWRLLDAVASHLATAQDGQPPDFPTLADLVRHPDVSAFVERELRRQEVESAATWLSELDCYQADHLQPVPGRMLGSRRRATVVEGICKAVERLLLQLLPDDEGATDKPAHGRDRKRADARGQQFLFEGPTHDRNRGTLGQLTRHRALSEWASGLIRLLELVYQDYSTGEDGRRDESMVACLDALHELTTTLLAIPGGVMPQCTAAQAIPVLLMQIGDRTIAAPPDESAIDLMGWLELPLDDSPVVAVVGFNEGRIPQSASSDVFLPNTVRTQLGLTDNNRRYARDAWALETLLNNRQELRLIAGRRDAQGDPLAPSRLWFAGDAAEIPSRVVQFYQTSETDDVPRDDATGATASVPSLEARQHTGFLVPPPSRIPDPPNHIPVTHFRDYIDCPYRYLLRRELGLISVEDEPREMDGRLFGNLLHSVLNRFGMSDVRHARDAKSITAALLNFLQQEAARNFGTKLSATVAVQLQMAEERLRAFAVWQSRQTADGWAIAFSERKLQYSFHDVKGRPLTINGRVDRIDHQGSSGQWRVLDYKTSENARKPKETHRRKGDWIDLQLPLYRLLIRELEIDSDVQLGYVNLPGDLRHIGASLADWTEEDLASADEKARQVAADILDMRISTVRPATGMMQDDLGRICQNTVVDRQMPWLDEWSGRSVAQVN
ncbi:MAG: PD-(D/E)XK nuclease family protein [Planctomycetaceae bacterium]